MPFTLLLKQTPTSDEELVGDDSDHITVGNGFGVGEKDPPRHPRTPGDILAAKGHVNGVEACPSRKAWAIGTGTLTAANAAPTRAAAAAADNTLDSYNDDDDNDEEVEAQTHDTLLPRPIGRSSGRCDRVADAAGSRERARLQEAKERAEVGVLAVVRIMLATEQSASFFIAVGLSGMGAGVIDTFLFIR